MTKDQKLTLLTKLIESLIGFEAAHQLIDNTFKKFNALDTEQEDMCKA